jgi:hypothetical protein
MSSLLVSRNWTHGATALRRGALPIMTCFGVRPCAMQGRTRSAQALRTSQVDERLNPWDPVERH